jgi:hypothetical protein
MQMALVPCGYGASEQGSHPSSGSQNAAVRAALTKSVAGSGWQSSQQREPQRSWQSSLTLHALNELEPSSTMLQRWSMQRGTHSALTVHGVQPRSLQKRK